MILPSLSILADLMPTSIPAPAFRSVDTADHLSVSTDPLHTRAHVQIQVPLEQVATVPYAREKAALHAVLERKDNVSESSGRFR